MRIVIQGKELTITLKSERELTTQEIVMAHQLSTGNYEALFIAEETEDKKNEKNPEIPQWVQVEMDCPVCTYQGRPTTKYGNVFTKCPECRSALFNKFSTDEPGKPDKAGNYYYANELIRPKNGGLNFEEQQLLDAMSREE